MIVHDISFYCEDYASLHTEKSRNILHDSPQRLNLHITSADCLVLFRANKANIGPFSDRRTFCLTYHDDVYYLYYYNVPPDAPYIILVQAYITGVLKLSENTQYKQNADKTTLEITNMLQLEMDKLITVPTDVWKQRDKVQLSKIKLIEQRHANVPSVFVGLPKKEA